MKRYYLEETDLIANCLIEVNKATDRRIIDAFDVSEYKKNLMEKAKNNDIFIVLSNYNDVQMELEKYIYVEGNKNYIMLPWVDNVNLIEKYAESLPHDLLKLLEDNVSNIKIDDIRYIKLEEIKLKVYKNIYEGLKKSIGTYEQLKQIEVKKFEKTIRQLDKR